jgi:hypothetical protein
MTALAPAPPHFASASVPLCGRAACHRRRTKRRRRGGTWNFIGPAQWVFYTKPYMFWVVSQWVNHLYRIFPIGRATQHREESFYASTPLPKLLFKSQPDLPLPQERKGGGTGEAKHKHTDGRRSRSYDTHNLPTPSRSDTARRRSVVAARVPARWTW